MTDKPLNVSEEISEDETKSKSQVKRDMQALRDLGKKLIALAPSILDRLPASERLIDAVLSAQSFKRKALSRQIGRIGVLMREEDAEAIQCALDRLARPRQQEVQSFHALEQWRDQLLAGDNALLNALVSDYAADRQQLRQLVRNGQKEASQQKPPKAARQLFQALRELVEE